MLATSPELTLAAELSSPRIDLDRIAKRLLRSPTLISSLFAVIQSPSASPSARARFRACKLLQSISGESPEAVYPFFDSLLALLHSPNSILRWNAILALGNLACVDEVNKLDTILEEYLALISGPQMIEAANAIRGATSIALAKPYLADRIAAAMISVEHAHYLTAECRNIAVGHAIRALQQIFSLVHDRRMVELFVRRQQRNPRTATRNKARLFITKTQHRPERALSGKRTVRAHLRRE